MNDILAKIADYKREEVNAAKLVAPLSELKNRISQSPAPRGFQRALRQKINAGQWALIAEIKKASPSKGLIREDFSPAELAQSYEQGGAACLSVLTDAPSFQGHLSYLMEAKSSCSLPILRKDFMLDPYQVFEARAADADCILLILAIIEDALAADLAHLSQELGLDVITEVHDEWELERALKLNSQMIGINNRNLKTFEVDLATSERLKKYAPEDAHLISESGLFETSDLARMNKIGIKTFLIGESLMRQKDVAQATRKILGFGE